MSTRRLCEPSLSIVQIEEWLSLGVQSRGVAVQEHRRGSEEELLLRTCPDEESSRCARARSRMERAIRNSDHSFPSILPPSSRTTSTAPSPVHGHLAKASSSSFTSTVRDPLFTCPLSLVPKSTIRFLIHAPYTTGLLITVPAVGRLHAGDSLRSTFMASGDNLIRPHATRIRKQKTRQSV